jgi:hypothetical protein
MGSDRAVASAGDRRDGPTVEIAPRDGKRDVVHRENGRAVARLAGAVRAVEIRLHAVFPVAGAGRVEAHLRRARQGPSP